MIGLKQHIRFDEQAAVSQFIANKINFQGVRSAYAAEVANSMGSTIEGSSFSGLLTRVEIGHILMPGYLRITDSRIKLGQYLFLRHGGKIVLIAQFLPVLRSIAGILAGANRMPWPHFMLTNIIGAFLWATFYGLAAYSLGRQAEQLGRWMVFVLGLSLLIFIVVAAVFVGQREAQLTAEAEQSAAGTS